MVSEATGFSYFCMDRCSAAQDEDSRLLVGTSRVRNAQNDRALTPLCSCWLAGGGRRRGPDYRDIPRPHTLVHGGIQLLEDQIFPIPSSAVVAPFAADDLVWLLALPECLSLACCCLHTLRDEYCSTSLPLLSLTPPSLSHCWQALRDEHAAPCHLHSHFSTAISNHISLLPPQSAHASPLPTPLTGPAG